MRRTTIFGMAALALISGSLSAQQKSNTAEFPPAPNPLPAVGEWQSIFDGKTLKGWKETPFTARGKVTIQDGSVMLGTGYMTGVNRTEWFPRYNYEVRMEAMRVSGLRFLRRNHVPGGPFLFDLD